MPKIGGRGGKSNADILKSIGQGGPHRLAYQ